MAFVACGGSSFRIGEVESSLARVAGTACLKPILATAFVVRTGQLLTTAHSIAGAEDDLRLIGLDGTEHAVLVIGFDPERDLALLRADDFQSSALSIDQPVEGDAGVVAAVSGDLLVQEIDYRLVRIVIARSGDIYAEGEVLRSALEIEATIEPGDSGAPLIDGSGAVVGVVFARSTASEGQAWALHPDEINEFLAAVEGEGEVDRGRCR